MKACSAAGFLTAAACSALVTLSARSEPASIQSSSQPNREAARIALYRENPFLRQAVGRVGGFGNTFSAAIANRMYSRTDSAALADAARLLSIEQHGDGTWLLRFPWVNVAVFETTEGLVLIDTAYAPAGPALLKALKTLSDKPVHTIIYTHHHIDHMLGAWALLEDGANPEIISSALLLDELQRDIKTRDFTARLNNQRLEDFPRSTSELPLPTRTFHDRLELSIGRDRFILSHAPGETADQLWVSIPTRQTVVIADYFQPFLPNAGNGKRRQRYVESWARALREMVATQPELALPMHGPALQGAATIASRLGKQASMLESIATQTIDGLNRGIPKYDIANRVELAPALATDPDAAELYSTPGDIAKTVAQEYSGWWNELPSEWNGSDRSELAQEIVQLAGGIEALHRRIEKLRHTDIRLACHLVDLAWLASPTDARVLQLAIDVWLQRLRTTEIPTQEAVTYVEHLVTLRQQRDAIVTR